VARFNGSRSIVAWHSYNYRFNHSLNENTLKYNNVE